MKDILLKTVEQFKEKKIVVIGDIMLDKFTYGIPSRINPEAPTILLALEREEYHLGGAGNVASNIISLGAKATIFSFAGDDNEGNQLKKLLENIGAKYFFEKENRTISKERIVGDQGGIIHQVVRIDREDIYPKIFSDSIKEIIIEEVESADIVIISDYAKGTITKDLMTFIKDYAHKTVVDPKQFLDLYNGSLLITPNEVEAINLVTSMRGIDEDETLSPKDYLEEGKRFFQGMQKLLAFAFVLFEAMVYVLMQGIAANPGFTGLVIFQLVLGGILIIFMDEVVQKWGFGSGVSLFIAAGIGWRLFAQLFQFIGTNGSFEPTGRVLALVASIINGDGTGAAIAVAPILVTAALFLGVVFAQSLKVEIPLAFDRIRGHSVKWPLQFFLCRSYPSDFSICTCC